MLVENSYTTRGQLARIDSKWAIPSYIDRKKQMGSVYRFSKCEVIQKEWFAKPKCTLNIRMKKAQKLKFSFFTTWFLLFSVDGVHCRYYLTCYRFDDRDRD